MYADKTANSLDPDQERLNVGPDLDPRSTGFLLASIKKLKYNSPITAIHFLLTIPLGRRWNAYFLSPITTVCPALLPP